MRLKTKHFYEFGEFRLNPHERLLLRDEEVVPLPPKAVEVLVALVENQGSMLTKEELMRRVWSGTFVEEGNLANHIFTLRRALGDDKNGSRYIETLPRRGYRFVAPVREWQDEGADIIIEERRRSHILIEEESNTNEMLKAERLFDGESNGQDQQPETANSPLQLSIFKRQGVFIPLLAMGLLLIGSLLFLASRAFFKSHMANASGDKLAGVTNIQMKITRLTSTGKGGSAISPDGKFISYSQNSNKGAAMLYLRQVMTNKEIPLIEPGDRVFGGIAFSPDAQFIYYVVIDKSDPNGALYRVPVLGGPPTRLVKDVNSMFSLSPGGNEVTFYRYSPDRKQRSILIAGLDGSGEQTLLTYDQPDNYLSGIPAWSPDGQRIAFAAFTGKQESNGRVSLFSLDLKTQEVSSLTSEMWGEIGKMTWSQDGQSLFFVGSRPRLGYQLYDLDFPQGNLRRLTSGVQGYGNYGLGISADGSTLVADGWVSACQLWSMSADGQIDSANRLTTGGNDGASGVSVLADGKIVYVSHNSDDYDLWVMKEDGTEAKALTSDSLTELGVTSTPQGQYLVFASNRDGGSHLFRLNIDGSNLTQLTYGDGADSTPNCSPDGKWVVYASQSNGKTTIWKVAIDGGTPIQLTDYHSIAPSFSPDSRHISCILPATSPVKKGSLVILSADGGEPIHSFQVAPFEYYNVTPRWTPDGQAIIYSEKQDDVGNLWKQSLAGGPPHQLTDFKSDIIFNFTFSPDGKRLVMARGPKGSYVVLIKDFR